MYEPSSSLWTLSQQHCTAVAIAPSAADSASEAALGTGWSEEAERKLASRHESKCGEESDTERQRNWTGEGQSSLVFH